MAEEGKKDRLTVTVSFADLPQLHGEIHDAATAFRVNAPAIVYGIIEQFAGKIAPAFAVAQKDRLDKIASGLK